MRYLPLLLLFASCQSWGWSDTADALLPDEFTMGQGSSTSALTGDVSDSYGWHDFDLNSTGESDSTYAALTWDIPSVGRDESGMDRRTQRQLALALDKLVGDEIEEEKEAAVTSGPLKMNLREGVEFPSKEILFGVLGALLLIALFVRYKANASRRRW